MERLGITFKDQNVSSEVLRDVSLDIAPGEVVALRGANGTGKTTLLNLVARLATPTAGTLRIEPTNGGRPLLGFVQQDYTSSLLPWFDVLENVAIPLRLRGIARRHRRPKAAALLESLGFGGLPLRSYPHQLSGGQRQRVAIARALVGNPALLLLDEPFANLDSRSVRDLQEALLKVQREQSMTVLFVSHELDSSVYLADRVIILHGAPATIAAEFPVKLPRPRGRSDLISDEFSATRAAILRLEESLYATG